MVPLRACVLVSICSHRGGGRNRLRPPPFSLENASQEEEEPRPLGPLSGSARPPIPSATWVHRGRTVDDPGHPPQPEQNQQAESFELVLVEQEDHVEDEGDHHHDGVQDFKLVVEELQAEDV